MAHAIVYYIIIYYTRYVRYYDTNTDDELQAAATRLDFSASCSTRIIHIYWTGQQKKHTYLICICTRVWVDIIGQSNATCSDQQGKHNKNSNNNIMTNRHIIIYNIDLQTSYIFFFLNDPLALREVTKWIHFKNIEPYSISSHPLNTIIPKHLIV